MFALCVPGLAELTSAELGEVDGLTVTGSGFDGRSDVVLFDAARGHRSAAMSLRTAEDVFVEVGRTLRSEGDNPRWIAKRIWRPQRVEKALSAWAEQVRPLSGSMSYRVIARVLQEQSFLRTDLRNELGRAIGADRPKWRLPIPPKLRCGSANIPGASSSPD